MLTRRRTLGLMAFALALPSLAHAKDKVFSDGGFAIRGTDPVAYFTMSKPVKGSAEHISEWMGATWAFASAENKATFDSDPERYAPKYGGYCAWAIAKGSTRPINPTIFRIFDDKLYLNLNMKVHKEWLGKHNQFITEANEQWPDVLVLAK